MVKTKSIRDPVEPSDGKRILIMRLWPRNYSHEQLCLAEWRPDLAPSNKLRQDWYAESITWDQYVTRYLNEMQTQQDAITELAQTATTETITLLCIENETNPHCHRHLLKRLMEQGIQHPSGSQDDNDSSNTDRIGLSGTPSGSARPQTHERR